MTFKNESLGELSERSAIYLRNTGRSESTISKYVWIWQQIDRFLHERNYQDCATETIAEFIRYKYGDMKLSDLSHYQKSCVRQALCMIQFKQTGTMLENMEYNKREKPVFNGGIGILMSDYILLKKSQRLNTKTLGSYKYYLYGLLKYLYSNEIFETERISPLSLLSYCTDLLGEHAGAKHLALSISRSFLRYAYDCKKTKTDLSLVIPHDNYKKLPRLPSTYTKEEVRKMLATVNRSGMTGKRDYAILLLVIRLGLRASDVRNLRYDNISWSQNMVSFTQYKTGIRVDLPLPADVGEAIIDYLKYGRPESGDRHIFVQHTSPYLQLQEKAVSIIARKAICRSGIIIGQRKHGSHALRHTLASFLLEVETPLPVISEILGHKSIQTSMNYLRIDTEHLRLCSLDVPPVPVEFYEQKGGAFYE